MRDPQYLHSARHTICLLPLDPRADDYVLRNFGQKGFMVADHVTRLPELLPMLCAGLTR